MTEHSGTVREWGACPTARRFLPVLAAGAMTILLMLGAVASAHAQSGTLLVANQASGDATVIDLESGLTTFLPVGRGPHEAAISPDGRVGVVSIYGDQTAAGNQLAVIDLGRPAVLRMIDLGEYTRPHDVRFVPGRDRTVAVTSEATRRVVLVDVERGAVERAGDTGADGSHMLGITADGRRLFTANILSGGISELRLPEMELVRTIPVAQRTEGVAVTPDGAEVWVGSNVERTVTVVSGQSGDIVETLTGFDFPYRLAISADGRIAVVCDAMVGRIHVLDVASRSRLRTIDGLGAPRGVTVSADGRFAFVTIAQPGEVAVLDLERGEVLRRLPVGASPDGVAFGPAAR